MENSSVVARNCGSEYEIFVKGNEGLLGVKEILFILFVVAFHVYVHLSQFIALYPYNW